jgi:hypothetical protein
MQAARQQQRVVVPRGDRVADQVLDLRADVDGAAELVPSVDVRRAGERLDVTPVHAEIVVVSRPRERRGEERRGGLEEAEVVGVELDGRVGRRHAHLARDVLDDHGHAERLAEELRRRGDQLGGTTGPERRQAELERDSLPSTGPSVLGDAHAVRLARDAGHPHPADGGLCDALPPPFGQNTSDARRAWRSSASSTRRSRSSP